MKKIAFFDSKNYDKLYFNEANNKFDITYFDQRLNASSVHLAKGYDAVCCFVNDDVNKEVIDTLKKFNINVILMRCAGYSNVNMDYAKDKIHILTVPSYSPNSVAEHAMALLLSLNRKMYKAYNKTRNFDFSLDGLIGHDLYGKTVGIIGTGRIGSTFAKICNGFGMKILGYNIHPVANKIIEHVSLEKLLKESDYISLHCPLTEGTFHILNEESLKLVKKNVTIINTSRGKLIDSKALLNAINESRVKAIGLDVYDNEENYFFEDNSAKPVKDDTLSLLLSKPNVIITSHQAFFTEEALTNIASTTINNLDNYFNNKDLKNEVFK